jgi:hypothetical protein
MGHEMSSSSFKMGPSGGSLNSTVTNVLCDTRRCFHVQSLAGMMRVDHVYVALKYYSRIFSSGLERKITQRQYYARHLHISMNESGILYCAWRLFQEFIVDAYAQIEYSRLMW